MNPAHYSDLALLLLRMAGFGLALAHGFAKVQALGTGGGERLIQGVAEMGFPLPGVFAWAAALSEFLGGLFVGLGIRTRLAAAFAAFTMLVGAFGAHRAHWQLLNLLGIDRERPEVIASWGSPEMALLYLGIFLALVFLGGGRFSLERLFGGKP